LALFDLAVKRNVVFVPGDPFYIGRDNMNTLRLNFSCVDEKTIETGIRRLGQALQELLEQPAAAHAAREVNQ
jgi:2-aminoadipate transaminase